MADYLTTDTELTSVANAIRTKGGTSASLVYPTGFVSAINAISTGTDVSDTTAVEGDVLAGKYFHKANGSKVQGTIATKSSSDLTASGKTVTVPAGYYASQATKDVATGTATTPATTITANPSISVSSSGLITTTASATQSVTPTVSAGYVSSGTAGTVTVSGSNTSQLTTQAAQTITPGTTNQTIASGKYLTGTQTILGDANLVASNIASGVTIFGVSGTHSGGGDSKENEILDRTISGTYENSTVISIGVYAFCNCDKLKSVVLQNCTSIKNYAFQYCMSLKTVNTPKCTSIGSYTFYYCLNLNEVTFPLCTTVGPYAFGEAGLYYANFPECSTFGTYAFSGCNQLGSASTGSTGIYIPKCTNVASSMFANCKFLPTISLDKCLNIWNGAFYMCQRILSIYLLGSTVANLKNTNAFAYTPISNSTAQTGGVNGSIYVPSSLYNTYITSTNWVTYAARFVSV